MKALICELCGSNSFTKTDDLFACDYCHTKYSPDQAKKLMFAGAVQVDRSNELNNLLDLASAASLHKNWQEASEYANKALEVDAQVAWAWEIKGEAAGWLSTLADMRLNEVIGAFERAAELHAPRDHDEGGLRESKLRLQIASVGLHGAKLSSIAQSLYFLSRNHRNEYWSVPGVVEEHGHRCEVIVSGLQIAYEWDRTGEGDSTQSLDLLVGIVDDLAEKQKSDGLFALISPPPFTSPALTAARKGAIEELSRLDSNYIDPRNVSENGQQGSGGCFVVTATMGDESALPVVILREFRDAVLVRSSIGRAFIVWYYAHGPGLADWVRPSWPLRSVSFLFVVIPATIVAKVILAVHRGDRISR
jgi:hypothetical protein